MFNNNDVKVAPRDNTRLTYGSEDIEFWKPITLEDIPAVIPNLDKSAGPDGITAMQVLKTPRVILCKLLNIFICVGGRQTFGGRTIFYQKLIIPQTQINSVRFRFRFRIYCADYTTKF